MDCRSGVVTFTPNPCIDTSGSVDRVVPYSKLRCRGIKHDPGGGGINVARVLHRLGAQSIAVFPSGGSTGQLLSRLLKQEDILVRSLPIGDATRQDFTISESQSSSQYRFVFPGPRITEGEVGDLLQLLTDMEPIPDVIVASGSLPDGAPVTLYRTVAEQAAKSGTKTVLDTSGPALSAALEAPLCLIKPNLHEFQELVQSALDTEDQRLQAARLVIRERRVQMIALTMGADGALLVTGEQAWRGRAPKIAPISTVGAGDSFLGALVWQLCRGSPPDVALRFAIAAGSAALLSPGTELCRPTDIDRLLPGVEVVLY